MQRIVLKLGTNLLTDSGGAGINTRTLADLTAQIARVWRDGVEVLLVSSGSITAGRQFLPKTKRLSGRGIVERQVLAALGQPQLLNVYTKLFGEHNIPIAQALISRHDLNSRIGYLNTRDTLNALLEIGVLPIVNENDVVSTKEITGKIFGDNDRLSAMLANAMRADKLILLGTMQGLYSADPHLDKTAKIISEVNEITPAIEQAASGPHDTKGAGGMKSKIEAARIAMNSGVEMVIASGLTSDVVVRLCQNERLGTFFKPHTSHSAARKRWMLTGFTEQSGQIIVDDGAISALQKRGVSLLPAGIVETKGDFKRGDIVAVADTNEKAIAFGIASYDSADLRIIKGHKSEQIEELLPYNYGTEAIHRNNLTLI